MKRISTFVRLIVAIMILFTTFSLPADVVSQTTATRVFVSPALSTAKTCETHTIAISVENVVDLTAFELKIFFDPAVVAITEVENAGWLVDPGEDAFYSPANNDGEWNTDGYILFGMAQQGDGMGDPTPKTGSGDLIEITMQALVPNGTTTFIIDAANSMLVDWPDAFEIDFTTTNGVVNTANCPPTADDQTLATYINTPLGIVLTGSDPDDDPLQYLIQDNPTHGALSGTPPNLTYTPSTGFVGTDSFTFLVSDGYDISAPGTVTIIVKEIPIADDDQYYTFIDESLTVPLPGVLANDLAPNGAPLTAELVDGIPVGEGTLTFNSDGSFVYVPPAGWVGLASFTYKACNGAICSDPANVTIRVLETSCLVVDPASLEKTLAPDQTGTLTFSLTNQCSYYVDFELKEGNTFVREGFEAGIMPPAGGWIRRHRGDTNFRWTIKDAQVDPEYVDEGQYAAWVTYDDNNSSDEWLLSPTLDPSALSDLHLAFRAFSSTEYPGATMKVWVTNALGVPLSTEPLWDMIRDETWNGVKYRSVFVDLSAYAGYSKSIRIAWQYVGQAGQSFGLDMVDISSSKDISWLSTDTLIGRVPAGRTRKITVNFDSTGLDLGDYFAAIFVENEPYPVISVPVTLHVISEGSGIYLPLFYR